MEATPASAAEPVEKTEVPAPAKQLWLIPYANPLKQVLPRARIAELPVGPGVYLFRDAEDKLLYVGKSKCVRKRVTSYRYLNPERASRKVMRLVHTARSVRTIECASEGEALLLENSLIREHRPPFNVANAKPESYHYLGVRVETAAGETRIRLRLTPDPTPDEDRVFGAFKNRGSLQKTYAALLRALWLASPEATPDADYPHALLVSKLPPVHATAVRPEMAEPFVRFMIGEPEEFLSLYAPWIDEATPASFLKTWRALDWEMLSTFSARSLRILAMTAERGLGRAWITPAEADDFPIEAKFSLNPRTP